MSSNLRKSKKGIKLKGKNPKKAMLRKGTVCMNLNYSSHIQQPITMSNKTPSMDKCWDSSQIYNLSIFYRHQT